MTGSIRLLGVLVVFTCCLTSANAANEIVSPDRMFVSPDGVFSMRLVEINRQWRYAITDLRNGAVDSHIVMPTVLLYAHWTADSRAIVTVEHVAGGSIGRVLCQKNGRWTDVEIAPPRYCEWQHPTVTDLQIKGDDLHFRFALSCSTDAEHANEYSLYEANVSAIDGRITHARRFVVSEQAVVSALEREPSYVPAMQR